jgi:hypothetical protein
LTKKVAFLLASLRFLFDATVKDPLSFHGPLTPAILVNQYGCEKDARDILRANFYGWFDKIGRGLYALSPEGGKYLAENETNSVVAYYRMKAEEYSSFNKSLEI